MQFSDIITETGVSRLTTSDNFDFEGVTNALNKIDEQLDCFKENLAKRGITRSKNYFVEARYRFQVWELEIEIKDNNFNEQSDVEDLFVRFHQCMKEFSP